MAKLNRADILGAVFTAGGWNPSCYPCPEIIDSDEMIDVFGKLAKADVTEDMLYTLVSNAYFEDCIGLISVDWERNNIEDMSKFLAMFKPTAIKKAYRELNPSPAPSPKKEKVVEKVVQKEIVVEPTSIDTTAFIGALGKAVGESLVVEYGKAVAESAMPFIKEYIKNEYGKIVRTEKIVIPERGESEGVFHECFDEVATYVAGGKNVMLVGEAGTGKNFICKQVSELLNLPFYFYNKVSDEYQLKGYMDANGHYVDTPLYHAMKDGGLLMLDEMDASDESALLPLNSVLSDGYLTFPNGEFVEMHKDFRVVAGCNTFGTGATYMYTGRRQLDASTLNRFVVVEVGYSPTIEESLTDDADLLKFIRLFRQCCKEFGINHVVSYRNIIDMDMFVDALGVDKVLKSCLLKNLEKDDLSMLKGKFADMSDRWSMALKRCFE